MPSSLSDCYCCSVLSPSSSSIFEFEFVFIRALRFLFIDTLLLFSKIAVRSGGEGQSQMLTNEAGEVTSHIQGMFNRTIRMLSKGVKPCYIFDGKPPQLKGGEVRINRVSDGGVFLGLLSFAPRGTNYCCSQQYCVCEIHTCNPLDRARILHQMCRFNLAMLHHNYVPLYSLVLKYAYSHHACIHVSPLLPGCNKRNFTSMHMDDVVYLWDVVLLMWRCSRRHCSRV